MGLWDSSPKLVILINPGISNGKVSFSPELRATHQSAKLEFGREIENRGQKLSK